MWEPTKKIFSRSDRKKLVTWLAYIGVKECFRNHVYRFESKYYVQKEGGAIGLRLTGIVAEISMAA